MVIIWSLQAKKDLRNIYKYSRAGTENTIKRYILKLIDYTEFLGQNPYLGKKLFVHNKLNYHILIYRKHKIIYTVTNKINIVSIIHSSRNIQKILNHIKSL